MSRKRMERTEVKILLQGTFILLCSKKCRKVILLWVKTEENSLCALQCGTRTQSLCSEICFYKWNKFVRREQEDSAPQWPLPKQLSFSAGTRHLGIKSVFHLEHGRGFKQLTSCGSSAHIQTSRNSDPPWIKWKLSS